MTASAPAPSGSPASLAPQSLVPASLVTASLDPSLDLASSISASVDSASLHPSSSIPASLLPTHGIDAAASAVAAALMKTGATMACAESCTGGLIAAACTALAGSSAWFDRGFVTYSNAAKTEMLGVPAELIAAHGAVSEQVAIAMADGALSRAGVSVAVAVTGIAGPGGASPGKPVGTVWTAVAAKGAMTRAVLLGLDGDRGEIRRQTVLAALRLVVETT
jgi:nicotinamide-nucleotide amidase